VNSLTLLLLPPITFVVVLAFVLLFCGLVRPLAAKNTKPGAGRDKSYACGEDVKVHMSQPEYKQFFPFAYFFTIMHVIALIVATAPSGNVQVAALAILYLLAAVMGLFILFRS
jgi:NADH-quinone oxidoreductase subunit A